MPRNPITFSLALCIALHNCTLRWSALCNFFSVKKKNIRKFVAQNCLEIVRDIEKLEPLTDGFTHFQLIQKTMNTRTQYTSANITIPPEEHFVSSQNRHVDTVIVNDILKKGTCNSFVHWDQQDYDMAVTRLQMPHVMGGFGLTPNVLTESTAKVTMGYLVSWGS
jgi:hypothetical protein